MDDDCIRGECIPLAELVTSNSFQRPTAEKSCFGSDTGIIELSVPEFNGSKSLRSCGPHVLRGGRKQNTVDNSVGKVLKEGVENVNLLAPSDQGT